MYHSVSSLAVYLPAGFTKFANVLVEAPEFTEFREDVDEAVHTHHFGSV